MLVFVERWKPENLEKNPRSKDENHQQQIQPTFVSWLELKPEPHFFIIIIIYFKSNIN